MNFRLMLGCALIPASVATFFLLWQLADGIYDGIWIIFLGVGLLWGSVALGFTLERRGHPRLGMLMLLLPVLPFALYLLFILVFVASGTSWR